MSDTRNCVNNLSEATSLATGQSLGLVAGWGSFPIEIAERCAQQGIDLYVIGIRGHADPQLIKLAKHFRWMGVAKLGGHIRFFHKHGVDRVALAGKLFKNRLLYHGMGWLGLVPDWTSVRTLSSIFITRQHNAGDDSILGSVVAAYDRAGIRVLPLEDVAPALLAMEGLLAGPKPNHSQWSDIQFGWQLAGKMGGLDIGQSVTIKDQLVLAVEAIEGTDAMIVRSGKLCPRGGFTLVKVAKPQQDHRFDLPTIGPRTIQTIATAGGKCVAIQAGSTIIVQRTQTLATAERLGITIVSIAAGQMSPTAQSSWPRVA
ncbi:MAG: UDP-2,3-diacylglucosamine diphosphatase LpxI [Pirellulaceae bacterium]|nr:UDP-2,3-diacylglucosamine diphosphatase LpxI [Pirellulaceae bacterium]